MVKPEQIPREARDAFYKAYWTDDASDEEALAAMLNAWPGAEELMGDEAFPPGFFLPLPKEPRT